MTLKEFMEKPDSAVLAEAAKCGSMEELKGFCLSHGITVTDGEAEKLYALLSKVKMTELSDEDLDKVAGGGYYVEIKDCPNGHTRRVWHPWSLDQDIMDDRCYHCEHVDYRPIFNKAYCKNQDLGVYKDGDNW